MSLKQQITAQLIEITKDLGLDVIPNVDYPVDSKHGDYASNIALVAAKKLGKKPMEVAEELRLKIKDLGMFENVEVAPPGFINFRIKLKNFIEVVDPLLDNKVQSVLVKSDLTDRKVIVEYTDPNPFKELHIGHLYSNIIGESLSRLFEANGATVRRVDYYGDVGMHVAKSLWGIMRKMKEDTVTIDDLKNKTLTERITFLGEGYALGSNAFAEDTIAADEIKDINYLVYMSGQEYLQKKYNWVPQINYRQYLHPEHEGLYGEVKELYEIGKDWSLENFENLYKRLGTKFDGYYPESIAGERGYKIVKDNIKNGIFVESEGAVIFPGEKQGLHNRVFINKLGLPTYEAKELGLAPWKYEEFKYDLSLIVTASEIAGYFGVLMAALKKVNPELGERTIPLLHGMVRLPEGKMSSRSGNVITVSWLLDEAKKRVLPLMNDEIENKEEVAEQVGMAAVKYAFLRSSVGKDIVFDLDDSVSFDGNSGPYLQYTFARTQSVLRKVQGVPIKGILETKFPHKGDPSDNVQSLAEVGNLEKEERDLLRLVARFPEVVEDAATRFAPHVLCTYLFDVAQAFNLFYQKFQILKAEGSVRNFRLQVTTSTGIVLKQGLHLLGIKASERM